MYGYSAEEVLGRSIALLVPPDIADDLPGILERLRRGEEVEQYETKRMRKDEVVLDVALKVSAIRDVDGQIIGSSSIARDVTRFKAQAELERERALLAHLVGAGEEEREPDRRRDSRRLHPGDHRGGNAAADPAPQPRRSRAAPAARRARGDDPALDHATSASPLRASSARARHRWALRRPRDVHRRRPRADGPTTHRLEDNLRVQPSLQVRTILYRIVQELLANVRTHAQAENATVVLDERDYGYRVRVSDDGVGFAPEKLQPVPGHLGLAAMQERASLAGGWLRIDSAPGKGTTVEFWIPSLPVPDPAPPIDPTPLLASRPHEQDELRIRVLVAEDAPAVREALEALFRVGARVGAGGCGRRRAERHRGRDPRASRRRPRRRADAGRRRARRA